MFILLFSKNKRSEDLILEAVNNSFIEYSLL